MNGLIDKRIINYVNSILLSVQMQPIQSCEFAFYKMFIPQKKSHGLSVCKDKYLNDDLYNNNIITKIQITT